MALSEFELKRASTILGAYLERCRPPLHVRAELDLGFRITGQSVELFEVRPVWRGAPGQLDEHPFAKATWVKTRRLWRIYWRRADLKWHRYPPAPEVTSIDRFIEVVERDEFACFHG